MLVNNYNEIYADILARKLETNKKDSSLIQKFYNMPTSKGQSLSIRTGEVIEEFLNVVINNNSKVAQRLYELDLRSKRYYIGGHQIDVLFEKDNTIYHREVKCNIDLDNGKQRDIAQREEEIVYLLKNKYPNKIIKSGILNPLNKKCSQFRKLGVIDGIEWFCDTVETDLTADVFLNIGSSVEVQAVLKNKGYI